MSVPKLRFPGFVGEWEARRIGDFSDVKTGAKDTQDRMDGGKYPFFVRSDTIERIDTYAFDGEAILTSGDGVGVGKNIHYINGRFDYHQRVYAIRNFSKIVDGKFFFQFFKENFLARVMRLSAKNSVDSVRMSMVTDMKMATPSLPEQQKIAAFLGAVDAKLAALAAKQAALGRFKAGLMQKLFSQQLRFTRDDGTAFPDWEEKRLGDVADIYQPQTISQIDLVSEGYTVYGANGIIGKYTDYNHEQPQVTVTCRGNTCGSVSYTKPFSWITGNSMVINLDGVDKPSKKFMYFMLSNTDWTYLITGSGQPQITGVIKKHKLRLPHPDEQQKIADALTAMDVKIRAVADQVTKLQTFKKGLLQQMFV